MTPSEAEAAIREKMRRGEAITLLDHIPTIRTAEELASFREQLPKNKREDNEIRVALTRQEMQIGRSHSR